MVDPLSGRIPLTEDGGHTTVPVRKYIVEEEEEETKEPMCARHGEEFTW